MLFPLFLFAHESLASLSFSRQGSKQCQWWRMVCIYLKTIEKAEKTGRIYFEKHVMNDQTLALAYAIFSRCMHFSLISLFSGGISLAAGLFFMFQSLSTCVYFEKFAFTLKSNPRVNCQSKLDPILRFTLKKPEVRFTVSNLLRCHVPTVSNNTTTFPIAPKDLFSYSLRRCNFPVSIDLCRQDCKLTIEI